MNIILFLLFITLNFVLVFLAPHYIEKSKLLKIYALLIPSAFAIAIAAMLFMKGISFQPNQEFKAFFISIIMAVLLIMLMNIMIIIFSYMINGSLLFQHTYNAENVSRFPVSFVSQHKDTILLIFKVIFFLGSCWMLKNLKLVF